ncbi:glycerophosphodiester phosphodiesterase [Cohnella cellulosilytica]|uniref:Glycerophosphodiester phosphodiesterase n=1 Tax=Cohnella cellulosilytica TaxID=986710 RepID=A0ABW2FHN3_9BACL
MRIGPVLSEREQKYPRLCSHRGFNNVAPENSLPALAMAVALGAEEIEFDLWPTKDGDLVVCHDTTVDRTSNGTGKLTELAMADIRKLDMGSWFDPRFKGTRFPSFEEVLALLAKKTIMNIHLKSVDTGYTPSPQMRQRGLELRKVLKEQILIDMEGPHEKVIIQEELEWENNPAVESYDPAIFRKISDLIDKYDCRDYVYITGEKDVLMTAKNIAPHLSRNCLEGHMNYTIVENALKYDCERVQFCKLYLTKDMIDRAHHHGMRCNLFWSDHPQEADYFLKHGIDTILVNDFLAVKGVG